MNSPRRFTALALALAAGSGALHAEPPVVYTGTTQVTASADGGLRLLPGTHHDSFLMMAFRKPYFVAHKPDKNEVAVETWPGDLTVHDGRAWHRVQTSPHTGWKSLRHSLYRSS